MTLVVALLLAAAPNPTVAPLTDAEQRAILEKTREVRLAPELNGLTEAERFTVDRLIQVGRLFQDLYEQSKHPEALAARARLMKQPQSPAWGLYRLSQGPIATTLDNRRAPITQVRPEAPGRNVYPYGISREEVNAFLEAHPDAREALLDPLTVVRRADKTTLAADRAALKRHPVLATLHPAFAQQLKAMKTDPRALYAAPYAVAYADALVKAHALLREAAERIAPEDAQFADYLRHRARDLLTNDYEAGDASWVTGEFKTLNAQIGAYETYDDELFGQKAFFSLSLLRRDDAETKKLTRALGGLQKLEDSLPYQRRKQVRPQIPLGVYDVVADFGQSRSANTASILPNDADHARRYGRTVLMRANVLRHPGLHEDSLQGWRAVVAKAHHHELTADGKFHRTVWHEIGHYLGPDSDEKGRPLTAALEDTYSAFEEMKADLVSLHVAPQLKAAGFYDEAAVRGIYASGIHRTINDVKPRRVQPYQTMQLIQFNWFLQNGLIALREDGLHIDYARYPAVVKGLLQEVLSLQAAGNREAADAFITRWTTWDDRHEALAAKMQAQQRYRFRAMRYGALGDPPSGN